MFHRNISSIKSLEIVKKGHILGKKRLKSMDATNGGFVYHIHKNFYNYNITKKLNDTQSELSNALKSIIEVKQR